MRRFVCSLALTAGLIPLTSGCSGGSPAAKLDPVVAKQRQDAYESKMIEGDKQRKGQGAKPGK